MSSLAEVLHFAGYCVQGSDIADSVHGKRLVALGVLVKRSHDVRNVVGSSLVVISSAIPTDNIELVAARHHKIPIVLRADLVSEIMKHRWSIGVAGSHGKTTTSALIASILDAAKFDPTVLVGGFMKAYQSTGRFGKGNWVVVEANESDGSFVRLFPTIAVVTNVAPEHLHYFGTYERECSEFERYLTTVPFYGSVVLCMDHSATRDMAKRRVHGNTRTYGLTAGADIWGHNVELSSTRSTFDVKAPKQRGRRSPMIRGLSIPLPGMHNVQNALGAITVALEIGIPPEAIREGLSAYPGVDHRYSVLFDGEVMLIDDYGHHPAEIEATLLAARLNIGRRIILVLAPHRYSRIRDSYDAFCRCTAAADAVFLTEVDGKGEEVVDGITSEYIASGMRMFGHANVVNLSLYEDPLGIVLREIKPGDVVVCASGGSDEFAQALTRRLIERFGPLE